MKNLKLASRAAAEQTVISVGDVAFGRDFVVMAGPCSVESEAQTLAATLAEALAGGQQHVHLAARRLGVDPASEAVEFVGVVAHGADHHHEAQAGQLFANRVAELLGVLRGARAAATG